MNIQYNGKTIEINQELTIQEALKSEIEKKEYEVIGAIYNNQYVNLDHKITRRWRNKTNRHSHKRRNKNI